MKWLLGITVVSLLLLLMVGCTGCSSHFGDMKPDTMRAAIDNCQQNQLDVQVYQRPDKSVVSIRCLPRSDDVFNVVTLRRRVHMPLINFLTDPVDVMTQ